MGKTVHKRREGKSSEEYPESKYVKKGWASRDEQRVRRRSLRKHWKNLVKKIGAIDE